MPATAKDEASGGKDEKVGDGKAREVANAGGGEAANVSAALEKNTKGAADDKKATISNEERVDNSAAGSVNGHVDGVSPSGKQSTFVVPYNSLLEDLENGDLPVEVSQRIVKRAKELEEKRKNKKRKAAAGALNKFPGLSFNPEIELKKWEIHEQQKQQMIETLEEDIEIFAEISEELEQENFCKRREIADLLNYLSHGSSRAQTYGEEQAKIRAEVDTARSDLKWAIEEQKKLERQIQRERDRLKEEVLDHELTKRKSARLAAECEKRKIVYSIPKPDETTLKAVNDINEMRDKRDSTETSLPVPEEVPVTEKSRILEEREKMLLEELNAAKATLDKLNFDVGSQRDVRDGEAIITWGKLEKLGLLAEDVEFYRPFYDEKFQLWVDMRLWEQPTIEEVIHPGVRHAAQEISELWQENSSWLLKIHRLDDQELLEAQMAEDLEKLQEVEKTKDEKPEIERDIKDAKAERARLKEMNNTLGEFAKYLVDAAKKDEDDLAPIVIDKDDRRKELEDKIKECDVIIREIRDELPSARKEIEDYRALLDDEDKRRGEKTQKLESEDEEDLIKELARKAVAEARPRHNKETENEAKEEERGKESKEKEDGKGETEKKGGKEGKNPGKEGEKPGKEGEKPGKEVEKPGKECEKPEKEGEKPGKEGQNPGKEGEKPRKEGEKPGKEGEKPRKEGEKPGKEGEKPGKEGEKPGKEGEKPGKEGEKPGKEGEKPGKEGEKPGKEEGIEEGKNGRKEEGKGEAEGGKKAEEGGRGKDLKKSKEGKETEKRDEKKEETAGGEKAVAKTKKGEASTEAKKADKPVAGVGPLPTGSSEAAGKGVDPGATVEGVAMVAADEVDGGDSPPTDKGKHKDTKKKSWFSMS